MLCTVAGSGDLGYNGEGLSAEETWLFYPSAVDFDGQGRLVVVDYSNFLVRVLEEDGTLATLAGDNTHAWAVEGLATASPLENPIDIAFDADGAALIAEQHTGRLLRISDGQLSIAAGSGEEGYSDDGAAALDAAFSDLSGVVALGDAVYIADTNNHCIRTLSDGVITTVAGRPEAGFVDGTALGAQLNGPERMHSDGDTILIADTDNHAIRRLDPALGTLETLAGLGTAGFGGDGGDAVSAQLSSPTGITTASDGSVYIADSGNHRIRRIAPDGTITTVAGTGTASSSGDPGEALTSGLNWPVDVAIGPDGHLYIAEMLGSRVRRLSLE
ncbi:MAG: DNA-binding beta-propeller fold protein YncE [Myxococcota bacterium]|jgi:DNA-binding beta-propeller fold protein YncE